MKTLRRETLSNRQDILLSHEVSNCNIYVPILFKLQCTFTTVMSPIEDEVFIEVQLHSLHELCVIHGIIYKCNNKTENA
jgi:hypothetical protein